MTETARSVGVCRDCGHSMENNNHGFDQNDGYLDDAGHLVHNGTCTYCRVCNPRLDAVLKKKGK